jgi:type II secretory pathway pseudopilin PulG
MKLHPHDNDPTGRLKRRCSGMTLVEMMIATFLMVVVMGALVAANLIGFQENQYLVAKAGATNTGRSAVNRMLDDIRMAKGFAIGNISGTDFTTFSAITNGSYQGTALQLYPILISTNDSIDYTKYILYAFDLSQTNVSNGRLWRYVSTNQVNAVSGIVASNLINTLFFSSESYSGTSQYLPTYKNVIHTTLQFCEFVYPLTMVGSNYLFQYYRIDCRATPHLPDGP